MVILKVHKQKSKSKAREMPNRVKKSLTVRHAADNTAHGRENFAVVLETVDKATADTATNTKGKLFRGRPRQLTPRGVQERCVHYEENRAGLSHSKVNKDGPEVNLRRWTGTAPLFGTDTARADQILKSLETVLALRHQDTSIKAIYSKRTTPPPAATVREELEKFVSRGVVVGNVFKRETQMTVGEHALARAKVANSNGAHTGCKKTINSQKTTLAPPKQRIEVLGVAACGQRKRGADGEVDPRK